MLVEASFSRSTNIWHFSGDSLSEQIKVNKSVLVFVLTDILLAPDDGFEFEFFMADLS